MFASQLIYTGCGKDKSGAFSVWSKTSDITKIEENEIRDKMIYKRPANLPFVPSQEELDTLFPKKFAYFYLSTGRVCLAQSVYIGNVYSDLDKRSGNYIIHAFVFDQNDEIIPMNYIESDVFKRCLTYEEWHDQDAPDELPKVEITDQPGSMVKIDLSTFFDGQRSAYLKMLLQAIINASKNDQKITFNDTHKNLQYWYRAISACLPECLQSKLTFSTFFTPGVPLPSQNQSPVIINTEVKIRNISPTSSSALFSYQQDVRSGKYSFDFESGILPTNIEISSYVNDVVDLLTQNAFHAVMFVNSVEKISNKCNVDLDTAAGIHYLLNKQIDKIDEYAKLNQMIQYALQYYPDSLQDVADCLYEYGIRSGKWEVASTITDIYRFIFDYSEVADKGEMIHQYILNQAAFGVDIDAPCADYSIAFRSKAPFGWANFSDYIFDGENFKQYFEANGKSFNSCYLIFDTFAGDILRLSDSPEQKKIIGKYFIDVAQRSILKEQLDEILALTQCAAKCPKPFHGWLLTRSFETLCEGGKRLSDVCRIDFTLALAEKCNKTKVAVDLILRLIEENSKDAEFINLYIDHYDHNSAFYESIYGELNANPTGAKFVKDVEIYRFSILQVPTKNQLQNYYDRYFSVGKDREDLFISKLQNYLTSYNGVDCLKECLSCCSDWLIDKNIDGNLIHACADIICEIFFSVPNDSLQSYIAENGTKQIKSMLALASNNYHAPIHYYVIAFGERVKRLNSLLKANKKSPYFQDTFNKLDTNSFYYLPKGDTVKELFVSMYWQDIFQLYLLLRHEENFEKLYDQLFQPFYSCKNYDRCFCDDLGKLKDKDCEQILVDAIVVCTSNSNNFHEHMTRMLEQFFDSLDNGKSRKLAARLVGAASSKYKKTVKTFTDDFQQEKEGFFGKLFSQKKKEEPKEKSSEMKRTWKR